MEATDVLGNC